MDSRDTSEEQLINRAKLGDKGAITTLYERHIDQMYRYIAYRVPDTDAEDLTAEVFVKMIEGLPNFTYTGAPFEAWLYKIASARVADYHRKRGRRQLSQIDERLQDEEPLPEEKMQEKQEHRELRQALAQLTEEEQRLLILRFVERKSHDDIAAIMDKNPSALRVAQHRALKKLASHLDAKGKERHYLRGRSTPE